MLGRLGVSMGEHIRTEGSKCFAHWASRSRIAMRDARERRSEFQRRGRWRFESGVEMVVRCDDGISRCKGVIQLTRIDPMLRWFGN
jgi:hypothetical protein